MKVNYSYLPRQFADIDDLLKDQGLCKNWRFYLRKTSCRV